MKLFLDIKSILFVLTLMLLSPHLCFAQYDFSEQDEAEFEPVGTRHGDGSNRAVAKIKTLSLNARQNEMLLDRANELLDKSVDLLDQADKLIQQGYRSLASALLSEAVSKAKQATKKAEELHDIGGADNLFESKKIHSQASGVLDKVRQLLIKKPKDV